MERPILYFVAEDGSPAVVAPELYGSQLSAETGLDDIRTYGDGDDSLSIAEEIAVDLGIDNGRLLIDPTMWATFVHDLRTTLPEATFDVADDIMTSLRIRKDEAELEAIRRASTIADGVVDALRETGPSVVGMTEAQLASVIESMLEEAGGDGTSFDIIVGSGPNGAMPHHHHGDREIRAGEPVILDFGTRYDHYPSDQTRTLVFDGEPVDSFVDAFESVKEAQEAAVQAVEPGIEAGYIDEVAREIIEEHGFGSNFIHRTGHGVGLDVHEEPYIVEGSETVLEPGMVFSVEPGVYVEGEFGVRIEDLVAVTDDGFERLNTTDRGFTTEP